MGIKLKYGQKKNLTISLLIVLASISSYELFETSLDVARLESQLEETNKELQDTEVRLRQKTDMFDDLYTNNKDLEKQLNSLNQPNTVPIYIYDEVQMNATYYEGQSMLDCKVSLDKIASELGYVIMYDLEKETITLKEPLDGVSYEIPYFKK